MPLEAYEYPAVLYCDQCHADVETKTEDRETVICMSGKEICVPYKAAVCPACGRMLCERDRDFQIANLAE